MAATAAIILAHDQPAQVRRLIGALAGVDVFLHCDLRAPDATVAAMTAGVDAHVVRRRRTTRCSWSLVDAELTALRDVLARSEAEHIVVMSGSCYPLVSVERLNDELVAWRGRSRMLINAMPFEPWSTRSNPDGGMWRLRRRFVTVRDEVVFVRGTPLRTFKRPIPTDLELIASSQWKIYARAHARALLDALDLRPDLLSFWRTTLVPDEICAASVLSSRALVGAVAEELVNDHPWVIRWDGAAAADGHPGWLEAGDLSMLQLAASATGGKLFARKLRAADTALADLIDERLRTS